MPGGAGEEEAGEGQAAGWLWARGRDLGPHARTAVCHPGWLWTRGRDSKTIRTMSSGLRKALGATLLMLLLGFAGAPRMSVGPVGTDARVLAEAVQVSWPVDSAWGSNPWSAPALYGQWAAAGRPLAGGSLALSAWWHTEGGRWLPGTAARLRVENLVLLLVAAWAAGRLARRMLIPWCGREQARAAGLAVTFLGGLHPMLLEAATPLAARGDLLGLALGGLAAVLFLRGRQEHRHREVLAAGALAIAASLASALALFLPLFLAVAEGTSARRHRPLPLRVRTTLTTLALFALGVSLEAIPRASFMSQSLVEAGAGVLGGLCSPAGAGPFAGTVALGGTGLGQLGFLGSLGLVVEKLGLLLFPVNLQSVGAGGYGLAGILLLLALQPALVAARSAPRLWGWLIAGWVASLLVTEAARLAVRVEPGDLSAASVLLLPALVIATGLGLCATALSGARRSVLPALIVLGYAAISHANANGWRGTAERVDGLAEELSDAARLHGWESTYLVVDPLELRNGHDLLRPALPYLLAGTEAGAGTVVGGAERAALFACLGTEEFLRARERGLVLLLPPGAGERARRVLKVAAVEAPGSAVWREEGRSPQGVRPDPFETRALRVVARAEAADQVLGTAAGAAPVMHWRGQAAQAVEGTVQGAWLAGEHGPVALFDLTGQLGWLAGGRLRRIWFEGPLVKIASAALLPEPPPPASSPAAPSGAFEPLVTEAYWEFPLAAQDWPRGLLGGERSWVLGLCVPALLKDGAVGGADPVNVRGAPGSVWYLECTVTPTADGRALRCPQAAAAVASFSPGDAGPGEAATPLYWSLDCRLGGVTVARRRGQLR